jgi:acyl-CoA dehydrogenase
MTTTLEATKNGDEGNFLAAPLGDAIGQLSVATDSLAAAIRRERAAALAVASPYLALAGVVAGGWLLVKSALAARRRRADTAADADYFAAKESIARFYVANLLPQAGSLSATVRSGGASTLALAEDQF